MAILFDSINKQFKDNHVINDFSFCIEKGKVTYLLGPNGCGKTTLVNLMLGLLPLDSGEITFDGNHVSKIRHKVSVVFDEPPIYQNLTGYDNLILLSQKYQKIKTEDSLFEKLSLDRILLKKKAKTLSLGQRHRLAIAAAILRDPQYIILDEPAIGLDAESWESVKTLLCEMAKQNRTIIVTGHHYDLMEDFVDNIIVMAKSKIIFDGTLSTLRENYAIEVTIKTSNKKILDFGYTLFQNTEYTKKYNSQEEFEKDLLVLQDNGIKIESVKANEKNLKEMYHDLLS